LNVFPIELPPLRDRGDDIELLADHFLAQLNSAGGTAKHFTRACLERLRRHNWPGNVRELRNVIERAFILAENDVGVDSLPLGVNEEVVANAGLLLRIGASLAEMERRLVLATIDHFDGDKRRAAEVLKISLKTLYNRLNEYGPG
jgi:DNA-binding NtrC family response regulator